jgi:hypothetical protein
MTRYNEGGEMILKKTKAAGEEQDDTLLHIWRTSWQKSRGALLLR